MVDQSPRFGLNTNYAQGEDDWSHNDTVNLLDELAEKRDVIANRPASGTYDNEVYFATDENIYYRWDSGSSSWSAVGGKGASGSPVPGTSYFEALSTGEQFSDVQNNALYASENIAELPSIQTAVNNITADKQTVVVVGGVNEVSQTITLPSVQGGAVANFQRVGLQTAPDTVIKQANGAELSTLIDVTGQTVELDVAVDGNKANNTTAVTGISIKDAKGYSPLHVAAKNCDEGLEIAGDTENEHIEAYVTACDIGVVERVYNTETPDENYIQVRGNSNDGPYYKKEGSKDISTTVELGCESTTAGNMVETATGSTTLRGEVRGGAAWGVVATGGNVTLDSLQVINMGSGGVDISGAAESTIDNPYVLNAPVGIRVSTDDITIINPFINSVDDYAIDIQSGLRVVLRDGRKIAAGNNTGTAIRLGASGTTTFEATLGEGHRTTKITNGGNLARSQITFTGQFNDTRRGDIPNLLEGMIIDYNSTDGLPNYYNGTDWTLPDGTVT